MTTKEIQSKLDSHNMNIKDYLHLYIGCKIYWPAHNDTEPLTSEVYHIIDYDEYWTEFKPVLRPLSDMTEEECRHFDIPDYTLLLGNLGTPLILATDIPYLLSHHFDLFGLIEAGIALDATKL